MAKAWSESQHHMSLSERSGLSQIPRTSPAVQSLAQKGLKAVGLMLLVTPTPSAKLPQDTWLSHSVSFGLLKCPVALSVHFEHVMGRMQALLWFEWMEEGDRLVLTFNELSILRIWSHHVPPDYRLHLSFDLWEQWGNFIIRSALILQWIFPFHTKVKTVFPQTKILH